MTVFPEIRQELYEAAARHAAGTARARTNRERGRRFSLPRWLRAGARSTPLIVGVLVTAAVAFVALTALRQGSAHRATRSPIRSTSALGELHAQAGRLLGSGHSLDARIRELRGLPIVINVWASWCVPCREDFPRFASASIRYVSQVAFLGADTDDASNAARAFLARNRVGFPSYATSDKQLASVLSGGLKSLPTTIFIDPAGRVDYVHVGEYSSLAALERDIANYLRPQASAGSATRSLVSELAVLRRPQTPADRAVPWPSSQLLGRRPFDQPVPSLTRRVFTFPNGRGLFMVVLAHPTADGGPGPVLPPQLGDGVALWSICCNGVGQPAAWLGAHKQLAPEERGVPQSTAVYYAYSVVPDGVSRVRWIFAGLRTAKRTWPRATVWATVQNNVAVARVVPFPLPILSATWYSTNGRIIASQTWTQNLTVCKQHRDRCAGYT
jgi:thiol-disulfide isomerase/thioredoxin